ncbi:dihydrofolate reductase [Henriciella marina]|uniref:Dihydrofolate reductase n=1 Tax=Henriciella marina TaxID=453851 RepID=A0ABT4LWI1_9PROT|nr:dihydrofolate reductase [Henriciella marina]MCZ4298717.1 dihydrofolate reductase [Henriciella marina]
MPISQNVKLALIVARDRNGAIGKDGTLPWSLPDDLQLFKQITLGKPIIMGRKTWESLPRKPLPGRQNIVLTRHWSYAACGARVYSNMNAAIAAARAMAQKADMDEIFVIGGQSLFERAMPLADRLYITDVDADVDGDVFFSVEGLDTFKEVSGTTYPADDRNEYAFTHRVYERVADEVIRPGE